MQVYADFKCILKSVEINAGSWTEEYQDRIPRSFAYKLVCVVDKFSKLIVLYKDVNAPDRFVEPILKEFITGKK